MNLHPVIAEALKGFIPDAKFDMPAKTKSMATPNTCALAKEEVADDNQLAATSKEKPKPVDAPQVSSLRL